MFSMIFRLAKAYALYRIGKAVFGENGSAKPGRKATAAKRPASRKASARS